MEIFERCKAINTMIEDGQTIDARNELIKLLDHHEVKGLEYSPVVNHLIRQTGLYPYLETSNAIWQDKLVYELFKVDTGDTEEKTLHIEQAGLLKKLIEGRNIAVSAPTSFGKSFVIDAFIAIKRSEENTSELQSLMRISY